MNDLLLPLADELEALQECTIGLGAGDQKEMLTRMLSKIAALEAAVAAAEARRRELHNQLVELKGNVSRAGRPPGAIRSSRMVASPVAGTVAMCRAGYTGHVGWIEAARKPV